VFTDEERHDDDDDELKLWQVNGGVRVAKSLSAFTSSLLFIGPVTQFIGPVTQFIGCFNQFIGCFNQFIGCFNQFISAINQFISAINQFISAINQFISAINQFISAINQFISAINQFISAINQFISAINQFISAINQFISAINQFISGATLCDRTSESSGLRGHRSRVEYREGGVVVWIPSEAFKNFSGLCTEGKHLQEGGDTTVTHYVTTVSRDHNGSRPLMGKPPEDLLLPCAAVDVKTLSSISNECSSIFSKLPLRPRDLMTLRRRCEHLFCSAPSYHLSMNWTDVLVRSAAAWVDTAYAGDANCYVGAVRRQEGSVFYHECQKLTCYEGKAIPTGEQDPACCEWEGRWHICGSSFSASCEDYLCTNGEVTKRKSLSRQCCFFGSVKIAHKQEVVVGCSVLRCYAGKLTGTQRTVDSCKKRCHAMTPLPLTPQPSPQVKIVKVVKVVMKVMWAGGLCFTEPGLNMATFDGVIRAWQSECSYSLVSVQEEQLNVTTQFGRCTSEHLSDLLSCVLTVHLTRPHDYDILLSGHQQNPFNNPAIRAKRLERYQRLMNDLKTASSGRMIIFSDEKTWTVDPYEAEGQQLQARAEVRHHGTAAVWAVQGGVRALSEGGVMVESRMGSVLVWVPLSLWGKVAGLCGEFYGRLEPTSPLLRETPASFYSNIFPILLQSNSSHFQPSGVSDLNGTTYSMGLPGSPGGYHTQIKREVEGGGSVRRGHQTNNDGDGGGSFDDATSALLEHLASFKHQRYARSPTAVNYTPDITFEDIVGKWKDACQLVTTPPMEHIQLCRDALHRTVQGRQCGPGVVSVHQFWMDVCRDVLCGCREGRENTCLEHFISTVQHHARLSCTALKAPGCRWDGSILREGVRGYRGCLEYICRAGRFHRTMRVHPSCCQLPSSDLQLTGSRWMSHCQEYRCDNGTALLTGQPDPQCEFCTSTFTVYQ
ncbi:von Willebrand factor type D domain, partial [Trinorchestia longiramus]